MISNGKRQGDDMALTTIRRYRDLSEAIVARCLLETCEIDAHLCDENLIRLDWQVSNYIGGIRLQVSAEDESDAIAILDSPIPETFDYREAGSSYSQPHCPRCQSSNITFEGSSRKAALASLYVFSIPLPLGPNTFSCQDCAARWIDAEQANS
jgi:hypothetical protein